MSNFIYGPNCMYIYNVTFYIVLFNFKYLHTLSYLCYTDDLKKLNCGMSLHWICFCDSRYSLVKCLTSGELYILATELADSTALSLGTKFEIISTFKGKCSCRSVVVNFLDIGSLKYGLWHHQRGHT